MALEHVNRMKDLFTADSALANLAADIVVNGIILDNGLELPEKAITDRDLKHLSAREIYNILRQKQQKDPNHIKNKYGISGEDGVNQCLQPSKGGSGTEKAKEGSEGGPTNWKDVLNKAAAIARTKSYGLKGAGLKRIFNDLLEATIDWRDALYKYITASRTDFEGYDRRFVHSGQYLDDLGGGKINLVVFMDTSGSVDEELLGEFIAELRFAVNALPQITGELWYFDTKLYHQGDIEEILDAPKLQGGGGTCFAAALAQLQKSQEEDSTVQTLGIIFTDGYAQLRNLTEPDCAVMWCISPGGVESDLLPFGDVVRIMK